MVAAGAAARSGGATTGEETADVVARAAAAHPDAVAWRNLDDGSSLTIAGWDADANRLARGLRAEGFGRGDRVVLAIGPDHPFPWLVAYVGVHRAGATAVPFNTRLHPSELATVVEHAEAALVVEAERVGTEPLGRTRGSPARRVFWRALLDDDLSPLPPERRPDSGQADLIYTSGTSGKPKAVVAQAGAQGGDPPARWSGLGFLTCSPFSTTSGILLVDGPLRSGLSGWYLPRFDAGRWLEVVELERPVAAFLVPSMAQLLFAHPRFADADLDSLSVLTFGGAPMARTTLRRLVERLPRAEVLVGYGLTEFGAVSRMPAGDGGGHLGSVGRALEGVEIRVVDEHGADLGHGRVGEITVRGAAPPRRYFRDEAATERTWTGGWLRTGDLGYLDADGFLWITGRAKDIIVRGGNNVVPGDVEEVLLSHPDIVDAAVAGVPHDVLGEDVAAWVVMRDGARTAPEELRAFMLERLADYKVPRTVHLVDTLPRNASGKVVRAQLPGRTPR